jgi:hypothetical protein
MIAAEIVAQVVEKLGHIGPSESSLQVLRSEFPKVHFTYCMDDDVFGPKPAYESNSFNLYYIDGRDHCLAFTSESEIATGIVVAEVIEEDD